MHTRGTRIYSNRSAALLLGRAAIHGKKDAIADAAASMVSATIFLEGALGADRTIAVLYATIEAVRNGKKTN